MGYWYAVVPRPDLYDRYNYIKNPSFEKSISDNWSASGTTPSQLTSDSVYGLAACRLTTGSGDNYIQSNSLSVPDGESVVASAFVRNNIGAAVNAAVRIYDTTGSTYRATTTLSTARGWIRLVAKWTNDTGAAKTVVMRIGNFDSSTSSQIDVDAAQLVKYNSTAAAADIVELDYFDGDSDDAIWMAKKHNSRSVIAPDSRQHGQILNLASDLDLAIETVAGAGLANYHNITSQWTQADGAYFQSATANPRALILKSRITGSTLAGLHDKRQALIQALRPDRGRRQQAVRLFHRRPDLTYGDPLWRELGVYYDSGLEIQKVTGFTDTFALRLIAPDPFFYAEKWDHVALTGFGSVSFYDFGVKRDGTWTFPGSTGCNGVIYCVYYSRNFGKVYIGGTFTSWNGDSTDSNYIVAYDPDSGSYETLRSGMSDGAVHDIIDGPDGNLWVVGEFHGVPDPVLSVHTVAYWDGSTWHNADTTSNPTSGYSYAAVFDEYGDLYVCGDFVDFDGDTSIDGIAKYDFSASNWVAVDSGIDGSSGVEGRDMVADMKGNIYVVGDLNWAGGTTVYKIARYNIADDNWYVVGNLDATYTGLYGGSPHRMLINDVGDIYISGEFTTADDQSLDAGLVRLTNGIFYPVPGLTGNVKSIAWDAEAGELYAFDIESGNYVWAVWNGSSWRYPDLALGNCTTAAGAIQDGVIFVAADASGAIYGVTPTTADHLGDDRAYPIFSISLANGDQRLRSLVNETTGAGIWTDRFLRDGEQLTIDCRPGHRGLSFALAPGLGIAFLGNSAYTELFLAPGENLLTCMFHNSNAVTVTASWRATYGGID